LNILYGWGIAPIYGPFEISLISGKADVNILKSLEAYIPLIRDQFSIVTHLVGNGPSRGFMTPQSPNTVIVHSQLHAYPRETLSSEFGISFPLVGPSRALQATRNHRLCLNTIRRYSLELQVARVITGGSLKSGEKNWESRCGTRLLKISNKVDGIFVYGFDALKISHVTRSATEIIWPSRLPRVARLDDVQLAKYEYLVIIPDVHGDLENYIKSIWFAYRRVSNSKMSIGNFQTIVMEFLAERDPIKKKSIAKKLTTKERVVIVMLGDYVDKGPKSRECIELALSLEKLLEWKSILLYGNHEYMNFHGDASRYVHPEDTLKGKARQTEFSLDGRLWKRMNQKMVIAARTSFGDEHTLFVHANFDSEWFTRNAEILSAFNNSPTSIHNLNIVGRYVSGSAGDLSYVLTEDDSPVWSRALEQVDDDELCNVYVAGVLKTWNVNRIIVGHNPQDSRRVRVRCGGRVVLADVGISKWMYGDNGNPMALVQTLSGAGSMEAIYTDQTELVKG
jgi:predicted MPP superfamily phosphohydrolase